MPWWVHQRNANYATGVMIAHTPVNYIPTFVRITIMLFAGYCTITVPVLEVSPVLTMY